MAQTDKKSPKRSKKAEAPAVVGKGIKGFTANHGDGGRQVMASRYPAEWSKVLRESGWIEMADGWRFLFGGSIRLAAEMSKAGLLDGYGLTSAGLDARAAGEPKIPLPPRHPQAPAEQVPA